MVVALATQVHDGGGDGSALLVHGLGSDAATMWRLAGHLADRGMRVTCPDLRGHGASPPSTSYRLEELAGDVAALGEGWDVVIGHSLGGTVVAALLDRPGWTRRAVLVEPVLRIAAEDREALVADQVAEVGGVLTVEGLHAAQPRWDDEDVFRKVRAAAATSRHVVERTLTDSTPWDLLDGAARWQAQVLVVGADPAVGTLLPAEDEARLAGQDHVEVVRVIGAGHGVHRDDPEAVLRLL